MDGDKYTDEIINYIISLSQLNNYQSLETKKDICLLINGESRNKDKITKFGLDGENITMKSQCFHSAAAIYILLKYPHLKPENSFIDLVIKSNLILACLKIATDVLSSDSDCINFINKSDQFFGVHHNTIIIDNNKIYGDF